MRLSLRETRAALVEAGCRALVESNRDWGLGHLSFAEAIEASGVSRASAYRAFDDTDSDPQEAFRLAVLLETVGRTVVDTSVVGEVLVAIDSSRYGTDATGRAAEFREIIRRWSELALDSNRANAHLRAVEACRSAVTLSAQPDPLLLDAVRKSLARSREGFRPYFAGLIEAFGLRLKPWVTLDQFQGILAAIAGMALTEWESHPETRVIHRPTGLDGEDQEWTLTGLVVEGFALTALEADPAADVSADLSSWVSGY